MHTHQRNNQYDVTITGAFDRIDIRGLDGNTLKATKANGPRTYLGLQVEGFPNLLALVGPHNAATFGNIPRCIEQNVEWVTNLMRYMKDNGLDRVMPSAETVEVWTEHAYETAARSLFTKVDSWFMGIDGNVPGKQKRTFLPYAGGSPAYREKCDEVAANGYEGFVFERKAPVLTLNVTGAWLDRGVKENRRGKLFTGGHIKGG